MDKYEYNTENYNRVDGCEVCSEEITEVLCKLTGVDDTEKLENAIYDLYVTCQNSYNRDSFRVFYKTLAILTDRIQNQEYDLKESAERIEKIYGKEYYSADEIANDLLVDTGYVVNRLLDKIGGEE